MDIRRDAYNRTFTFQGELANLGRSGATPHSHSNVAVKLETAVQASVVPDSSSAYSALYKFEAPTSIALGNIGQSHQLELRAIQAYIRHFNLKYKNRF